MIVEQQKVIADLIKNREDGDVNSVNDCSSLSKEKIEKLRQLPWSSNILKYYLNDATLFMASIKGVITTKFTLP